MLEEGTIGLIVGIILTLFFSVFFCLAIVIPYDQALCVDRGWIKNGRSVYQIILYDTGREPNRPRKEKP